MCAMFVCVSSSGGKKLHDFFNLTAKKSRVSDIKPLSLNAPIPSYSKENAHICANSGKQNYRKYTNANFLTYMKIKQHPHPPTNKGINCLLPLHESKNKNTKSMLKNYTFVASLQV